MIDCFTDATLRGAVKEWLKDPAVAAQKYSDISKWDVSAVTDMKQVAARSSSSSAESHRRCRPPVPLRRRRPFFCPSH